MEMRDPRRGETEFRDCTPIFRPRSVALVGASEKGGGGWAQRVHDNLVHSRSETKLYLLNPKRDELWGRRCYPDFASLPEPVDLAITIIPAEAIPDALEEGVVHGLKGAIVYAAQFGEGGDAAGLGRAERLRALADGEGLRICGPNCMGGLALQQGNLFYPSARVRDLPVGPVGLVFQSGGTFMYWLRQGAARGLGFSYAVTSGNELDLDLADYINFLVEDETTRVIACMVEGVRRPQAFLAAARKALAAGKPILMVKIGRSERGARQAQSHTGALAGDDALFDAVCRAYGIVRCHSLDDLLEQALAFSAQRWPRGSRVAMACYSGGAKGLFLDYADESGLVLPPFAAETAAALVPQIDPGLPPDNPLDTGAGPATMPERFSGICRTILDDASVDMLAIQAQLPEGPADPTDPRPLAALAGASDKPILAFSRLAQNIGETGRTFQTQTGIPFLQGMPEACRALAALGRFAETRRRGAPPPLPAARETLGPGDLASALARSGVVLPRSAQAATAEEAGRRAAEVGFPVALKIVSPQASHKTEVGGVALGLSSPDEVRSAAEAMATRLRAVAPDAAIEGFLIQEMVKGLEVLVGFRDDPGYGPSLVLGAGGVLVEAIGDVAMRLLPVSPSDVRDMIGALRSKALFGAFRGAPAPDVEALCAQVCAMSNFFLRHRASLSDLEVNPMMLREAGQGAVAVDVRAVWK